MMAKTLSVKNYNSCCCGCSPHDFVFLSALCYVFGSFVVLIASILSGFFPVAFLPLTVLILSALVVLGNRCSLPFFYIPALLVSIICAFLFVCGSTCLAMYGAYTVYIHFEDGSASRNENGTVPSVGAGFAMIFFGLVLLVASIVFAYFVEVFYRGYMYLKQRNVARDNFPVTMNDFTLLM